MGPSQKNTDLLPSPSERVSDKNRVLSKIKGYGAEGVPPHWAIAPRTWPPTPGRHQGAFSQLQGWDHSQPGLTALRQAHAQHLTTTAETTGACITIGLVKQAARALVPSCHPKLS